MKKITGAVVLIICLFACQNNKEGKATIVHKKGWPGEQLLPAISISGDSLINIDLAHTEKETVAAATGVLNGKNKAICQVNIGVADSLIAELKQENGGTNIGFDHVSYPEHQNVSVSGTHLRLEDGGPGLYRIFITQHETAKPAGKFRLKVWVK